VQEEDVSTDAEAEVTRLVAQILQLVPEPGSDVPAGTWKTVDIARFDLADPYGTGR
jgi:hypothetical protein